MSNYPDGAAYDSCAPYNQDELKMPCYDCDDGFSETLGGKVKSPCRTCLGTNEIEVDKSTHDDWIQSMKYNL